MTDTRDYVLASLDPPSVWDFFPSIEAAAAKQEEANAYNVKLEAHGAPKRNYVPMHYDDYKAKEREVYLSRPAEEIPERKFVEMLGVLPPERWENKGDFESFLMCEHWSGPYTQQYVRRGNGDDAKYWTKLVDSTDRKTWMGRSG
jgi:hypothetical protein